MATKKITAKAPIQDLFSDELRAATENALIPIKQRQKEVSDLTTPQSVIHIAHTVSLNAYKLWLLMLVHYRNAVKLKIMPSDLGEYRLNMREIDNHFGYEVSKREVIAYCKELRVTALTFNLLSKDSKPIVHEAGFINTFSHIDRVGFIEFQLPVIICNAMENLEVEKKFFLSLNSQVFQSMAGKYEFIIYKLARDYVGVGRTPEFEIPKLRKYLGLSDKEYPEFKEFNRCILKKAEKAINDPDGVSDIFITIETKKEGRVVQSVHFTAQFRPDSATNAGSHPAFEKAIVPIPRQVQQNYLKRWSPEEIMASIERANEYMASKSPEDATVNPGAVYRTAINNNWGADAKATAALKQAKQQAAQAKKQQKLIADQSAKDAASRQEFLSGQVLEAIKALTPEQVHEYRQSYLAANPEKKALYSDRSNKFTDRTTESIFKIWLRQQLPVPKLDEAKYKAWLKTQRKS